jgi:hypothetical protein
MVSVTVIAASMQMIKGKTKSGFRATSARTSVGEMKIPINRSGKVFAGESSASGFTRSSLIPVLPLWNVVLNNRKTPASYQVVVGPTTLGSNWDWKAAGCPACRVEVSEQEEEKKEDGLGGNQGSGLKSAVTDRRCNKVKLTCCPEFGVGSLREDAPQPSVVLPHRARNGYNALFKRVAEEVS